MLTLDSARVGRDAGKIAEDVIAHLSGLVGAKVTVRCLRYGYRTEKLQIATMMNCEGLPSWISARTKAFIVFGWPAPSEYRGE
jgi:hypothetical protein